MKLLYNICLGFLFLAVYSCTQNESVPIANLSYEPAKDTNQLYLDSLKNVCQPGDLVVRLGDDLISDQIRFLAEKDPSYSHAGIIVTHNNKKMVCNISPGDFTDNVDTIRYDAIDSFLNARNNLAYALYRYDLSDSEKLELQAQLNNYHEQRIHFDKVYDLKTDKKLYCSEMIYKSLNKVTNGRIDIAQSYIPRNMHHLISLFFKKYKPDTTIINNREIIAIDNLYNNLHCRLVMKVALKKVS